MLGRSRPSRPEGRTHAYLMLLRIEVAAFHPATPPFVAEGRDTEMAVPVRAMHARFPVSSLWPYSSAAPEDATGRPLAVTLPYGVRTFLDGFASTAIARPALRFVFYYRSRLCPRTEGRKRHQTALRGFGDNTR